MNTPMIPERPRRQVHLDFHTSPEIPGVGSKFEKEKFQEALKKGHINSITVFAKCHHGFCYYPTKIGTKHPTMASEQDLLGEMIDAAHEIGVRIPVYITAGWSHNDAITHPEWTARNKDGSMKRHNFYAAPDEKKPEYDWIDMCLNDGRYARHIYELTEEICSRYPKIDGLFFDICFMGGPCRCEDCIAGMKAEGLDPAKEEDAQKYYVEKHITFMKKCKEILDRHHSGATIFFNSGGADPYVPVYHPYSTHFEMEDLPTAWGGYNKMPFNAKYFSRLGKSYLGMTGKFHLSWGEFGGFKPKEALKYEAATMAIYGAGCSIGDQLFPDGLPDEQTYENIGYAYSYLEKIEPYCYGGESTARLGFVMSDSYDENCGVSDMLMESQLDYEIITDASFSEYDAVILPASANLSEERISVLKAYLANGGKVLAVGDSIVRNGKFVLDCGLSDPALPEKDCDYIQISDAFKGDLPHTPFLCYTPSCKAENIDGEVLSETLDPYFSRTYAHFCGHKNTPYDKEGKHFPAAVRKGGLLWLAHDMPLLYKQWGNIFYRRYFVSALSMLYDNPVKIGLPSAGRCRLIRQENENRYCLNMTYAAPSKRGAAEIIDEILPIYNIPAEIRISEKVFSVRTLTGGETLPFTQENGVCRFTVPYMQCHECVILQTEK